jgi:hypothetical protein
MLTIGDHVWLSGGYDMEPQWLKGGEGYAGIVEAFLLYGNEGRLIAVVRIPTPITFEGVTGSLLILGLRYVGAAWADSELCQINLCAEYPSNIDWWKDKTKCAWVESHASYRKC